MTYVIDKPIEALYPVVLSVPHCGQVFTEDFRNISPLSLDALLHTADIGTERLVELALPLDSIKALHGRSFVDLNRGRDQLDPCVIENVVRKNDPQILSGYGVIPRFAQYGQLIHEQKITLLEAEARLKTYYDPYHLALKEMILAQYEKFGHVLVLDLHSAPATMMDGYDILLGTNYGTSCSQKTRDRLFHAFHSLGINTQIGGRFEGGYITQHYGKLMAVEVIQIEVNRQLIVDGLNQINPEIFDLFLSKWRIALSRFLGGIANKNEK